MLDRLRLLPLVIVCATLLFGLKVIHLVTGVEEHLAGAAYAEAADTSGEEMGDEMAEASEEAETSAGAEVAETKDMQADAKEGEPVSGAEQPSASEKAVLESLAARRNELDQRRRDVDLREKLLLATEKRVEARINELKEIESRIEGFMATQDQAGEEQLASLVKMYEAMKPKDAARIFERLDMGVLLSVVERMNSRKMAAVLADMDPVAAQELTVELATRRRLPETMEDLDDQKAPQDPAANG